MEDAGLLEPFRRFRRRHPGRIAFFTWMGGAETALVLVVLAANPETVLADLKAMAILVQASAFLGALLGLVPALLAGHWARNQGRPVRTWPLFLFSALVTFPTGFVASAILPAVIP